MKGFVNKKQLTNGSLTGLAPAAAQTIFVLKAINFVRDYLLKIVNKPRLSTVSSFIIHVSCLNLFAGLDSKSSELCE